MTDKLSPANRSRLMAKIRARDTEPELAVRKLVCGLGFRYRLHEPTLPGRPDLAFIGRKKVIFVHGCFWHQHAGCADATIPKSRTDFWTHKLLRNVQRDKEQQVALKESGWDVLILWECELQDRLLRNRIRRFLE